MDEVVARRRGPATFNGPLEAGVRMVAILAAAHPKSFDLQRLVAFDYLLVHTGDIGGPESLHPDVPFHSAGLLVRRRIVEQALLLMMTRDLIRREPLAEGIQFFAGENAAPFLASLRSDYLVALRERAQWLVSVLGKYTDLEFRNLMRRFSKEWIEEFQAAETSLGVDE